MNTRLADFQDRFASALLADEPAALRGAGELVRQPGFAVYRNTVIKGCIDAMQANFPTVARLTGEEWFRACAAVYVRTHVPHDPRLLDYGSDFPDFLAQFPPAAALPYLPGVARLDRYWTEAHAAPDEAALAADALHHMSPDALAGVVLYPQAAARWAWFDTLPVYTIWHRNRTEPDDSGELDWRGEGALLVRRHGAVAWAPASAAACAFLDACSRGCRLPEAAAAALAAQHDTDLSRLLAGLLHAGAFGRIGSLRQSSSEKEPS